MGGASFDPGHWKTFSSAKVAGKATAQVFTASMLKESLDPRKMKSMMRESCDDDVCPNSTAIMIGLDETGSMDIVPDYMVRTGFPELFQEIYNRKPVTDPHVLFMGIGDDRVDKYPLQISQFEAGMRLADQLTDIYLEGNGGGNGSEGYTLAWYAAAMHTKIDCFEKRGRKGYLFTIGDDGPNMVLSKHDIERILGTKAEADLTAQQLLDMVSRQWNVFHITVEHGLPHKHEHERWAQLLGERALLLTDYTKLTPLIVSTMQVMETNLDVATVASSWGGDTSLVVASSLKGLTKGNSGGVVRL